MIAENRWIPAKKSQSAAPDFTGGWSGKPVELMTPHIACMTRSIAG